MTAMEPQPFLAGFFEGPLPRSRTVKKTDVLG